MDLQTWVSLFAVVASFGSLYVMLRREILGLRSELKGDTEATRSELKGDIEVMRSELKGDIEASRSELKGDIEATRSELKGDIEASRSELKGDIASLAARIDRLDDRVYALAAGLRPQLEQARDSGRAEA